MKNIRKSIIGVGVVIFLIGSIGLVHAGGGLFSFLPGSKNTLVNTVRVSGMGKVFMNPDTAILNIGIETEGETSKKAQEKNKEKSQEVIETLKEAGIDEKDIKTQWYNIYPNYNYSQYGGRKFLGYQANHNLTIKIRDKEKVPEILDQVTESGVTNIGNVQYVVEDKEAAYDEARQKAAKDAKQKAGKLGEVFGFSVGRLVQVEELMNNFSPYPMGERGGAGGGGDASAIRPGDVEIQLTLNAVFRIER